MTVKAVKKTPSGRCLIQVEMRLDGCTPGECIRETLEVMKLKIESLNIDVAMLERALPPASPAEES